MEDQDFQLTKLEAHERPHILSLITTNEQRPQSHTPEDVPFGPEGANFLCNLLQHGIFLGVLMLMLMAIQLFGPG